MTKELVKEKLCSLLVKKNMEVPLTSSSIHEHVYKCAHNKRKTKHKCKQLREYLPSCTKRTNCSQLQTQSEDDTD